MAPEEETSGGPPSVPSELYRTLDGLEDLADLARQHFGHAVSLPLDEFHALTERLREDLPREITQAEEIAVRAEDTVNEARHKADTIIAEAHTETERIMEAARKKVAGLVAESPEVRFATAQHRDIIAQAQQAALNIRQDVDVYARETLDKLEEYVLKVQHQIRSGLAALDREREREGAAARR